MQSVTEYPKAGRHVIGYRFSVSDHPDHRSGSGLWFASMEVRRFVVCDYTKVIAERVRHGGSDIDYYTRKAEAVRVAGSPDVLYLRPAHDDDKVEIRWQANVNDHRGEPESDPTWYAPHIETTFTTFNGSVLKKVADYCDKAGIDRLYIRPADVVEALRPMHVVKYVDDSYGDWIIDPEPKFTARQLKHVQADDPAGKVVA